MDRGVWQATVNGATELDMTECLNPNEHSAYGIHHDLVHVYPLTAF